jgi:hypothetical protein
MDQSLFLFGWRHLKSWRKKSDGRPSPSLSLSYFSCVVLLPPPELNHAQATPFMFLFFCVEWKKNTDSFKSWAVLPRSHQHPPPPDTHTHPEDQVEPTGVDASKGTTHCSATFSLHLRQRSYFDICFALHEETIFCASWKLCDVSVIP